MSSMGKRGAAEAPGLGMAGFSYNLPLPAGTGASTVVCLAFRVASQVPFTTAVTARLCQRVKRGDGGMLLQIGEISRARDNRES